MKIFCHHTLIFCLFLLSNISSEAQQTLSLSLPQAIQKGLEKSKNLKLSMTNIHIASAKYDQAAQCHYQ